MTCLNHHSLTYETLSEDRSPVSVSVVLQGKMEDASAQVLAGILHAANVVTDADLYDVTMHRKLVAQATTRGGTVVFLGSQEERWPVTAEEKKELRRMMRRADRILLVGSAVFLPLDIGLGGTDALAIHGNFLAPMAEEYPDQPTASGTSVESDRFSSAISPFAAQKLLISLIAQDFGEITAQAVGQYVGLEEHAAAPVPSEIWKYVKKASGDRLVCSVLKTMNKNIEEPLPISEIARIAGTSVRQVQRQFKSKTQASPQNVYREIRLNYAHNLVTRSNLPVIDVALATGFRNYGTFHENFKRQYGESPTNMRRSSFFGVR